MTDSEILQRTMLTPEEVARILRLSKNGCYTAVARGDIPSVRIGKKIMIPGASLRRMLGIDAPKP